MIVEQMLKNAQTPLLHIADVSGSALFQGDCLDIMPLIPDKSVQLILADLPYGTTGCKWDSIIPFEPLWEQYERIIKDDGAIVLFGSQPFSSALIMSNPKLFKYEWIWEKSKTSNYVHCKYQPLKAHENILVFSKYPSAQNSAKKNMVYNPQFTQAEPYNRGKVSNSNNVLTGGRKERVEVKSLDGKRYPRSVQYFRTAECENQIHPTQKPIELLKYLVATYSDTGEIVLDNVMGSGTCPLAAKELNRKFIGIEKEANYYEIACRRCGF
jgi:site-specific DNA-methyltransferase (adenine-specific)